MGRHGLTELLRASPAEILEHLGYRGNVQRAIFTAQDPKSLRQAFASLKPNREMRPLYEAAVARQQADPAPEVDPVVLARARQLAHDLGTAATPP